MKEIVYSIVIPVYNSSDTLIEIVNRFEKIFDNVIKKSYEIIFVNDCSDNLKTQDVLFKLNEKYNFVKIVSLTRNFGQQAATICGLKESKGDYIITLDDDLQHFPEDILKLIEYQNHDIVIGQFKEKKHSFFVNLTSSIKGYFDRQIIGNPNNIKLTSFRLLARYVVDGIISFKTPYPILAPMMFHITKDVIGVDVSHNQRRLGKSGYTFFRRFKLFTNLIINNSSFLLKFIGYFGITISMFSFIFSIFLVINKLLFNTTLQGWTSIIVTVLFIGGVQLLSVGVIGEYLIRIINTIEQKPTYIVKKNTSDDKN